MVATKSQKSSGKLAKLTKQQLETSKQVIEDVARNQTDLSADTIAKRFIGGTYVGSYGRSFYSILSVIRRYRAKNNGIMTAKSTESYSSRKNVC